ncbi:unnamed protein product, partial [Heterotrigona itama]
QPPSSDECIDGFGHAHPASFHRTPTNGDPCQPIRQNSTNEKKEKRKRRKEQNSIENLQPGQTKQASLNLSPALEEWTARKRDGCTGVSAVSQASAISSTFRCLNATKNDEYDEEEDGFWWVIARPKLPRSQ